MKEYTTSEPVFSDVINVVESTDPVNPECNNTPVMQLLQNTLALKQAVAQKAAKEELDTHTDNGTAHITAAERTKWNGIENKHEITRLQIFPESIKDSSNNTVASLSIPAGGNSGRITIMQSSLRSLKGVLHVDMGWNTANTYALLVSYCCINNSSGTSGVSLVIWNLGQSSFTLTKTTSFNVIGWE